MHVDDPLLPPPSEDWSRRPEPGEDPLRVAFEGAVDYVNMAAITWPAIDQDEVMRPPPPEHVLDHLARVYDLVPEEEQRLRPPARRGGAAAVEPADAPVSLP